MSLPFDLTPPEPVSRRSGHVPASSVEAYQRLNAHARAATVVRWLQACASRHHEPPTSAELTREAYEDLESEWGWTDRVLYVRRGLSDALKLGLVEHAGKRRCRVMNSTAVTWKVRTR